MATIQDKVTILKDTKSELKKALEYKGVTDPGDDLTQYAQKFSSLMPSMSLGGQIVQAPQTYGYTLNQTLEFQKIQQDGWNKATEAGKLAKEQFESNQVVNFVGNQDLVWAPKLDNLKDQTSLAMLYESCSNLTVPCPSQEWPETASMNLTFASCSKLTKINLPQIKITSGIETFADCSSLTQLPQLDYSECSSLNKFAYKTKGDKVTLTYLNTSELCTDFDYAFKTGGLTGYYLWIIGKVKPIGTSRESFAKCTLGSGSLAYIDLSEATDLAGFFRSASFEDTEATFSIPKYADIRSVFSGCTGNLTSLTLNDLQNSPNVSGIIQGLDKVTTLTLNGDFSGVTGSAATDLTYATNNTTLTTLKGFKNCKYLYSMRYLQALSNESVQNLITDVYDFTAAGETPSGSAQGKMTFYTDVYAQITDEQKAQATAKGWTITSAK